MPALPVPPGVAVGGVPVGTIVPYVGSIASLPPEWVPCDGRLINVPGSPLNGQVAPRLGDNRFFMSVMDDFSVLNIGGTKQIPFDGDHSHPVSGVTDPDQAAVQVKPKDAASSVNVSMSPHTHTLRGTADKGGSHNHGGDNRPSYVGVLFILKVA